MKRFDFRLERVRRWRRGQADLEELKLHQLITEIQALDQRKRRLLAERQQEEAAIRSQASLRAEELTFLASFRRHVQAQSRALDELRRQQEGKIAAQRECLLEARRRFELLDRLRHKALLEWQSAFTKEQEEMAAELFLAKRKREAAS